MGLGRFFKSLVNPEVMGEEIIALQERGYREAQKMYPNAEPHLLLTQVWLSRMAARGNNANDEQLQAVAFSETMQFACVAPPKNARALGLYFVYKERPEIIENYPKFGADFEHLMAPVFAAMENDQIDTLYSRFNPQMAAEFDKKGATSEIQGTSKIQGT